MPAPASGRTRLASREASRARDVRGAARAAIDAAARGRQCDGTEATAAATHRLQERTRALLRAEAEAVAHQGGPRRAAEAGPLPVFTQGGAPFPPGVQNALAPGSDVGPLAALADAGARAERAVALVEKVERFLRSGRPALSVSLRTREPARVELERVGRATVTLRLAAPRPPPPEEIDLLRTALATRGLRLRALEWVPLPLSPPNPGGR